MKGRFPANLLVCDDVLNDGVVHQSGYRPNLIGKKCERNSNVYGEYDKIQNMDRCHYPDVGSYSRYFDLDAWYDEMFSE